MLGKRGGEQTVDAESSKSALKTESGEIIAQDNNPLGGDKQTDPVLSDGELAEKLQMEELVNPLNEADDNNETALEDEDITGGDKLVWE
ncbi:hypothetical protein GUJ93_ZPchr0012g21353 [Zizania palustris]|uniref:Uncharacterized protein n=1 Tax=Zizania palustris TaxID=103762 RepID=A0A8J5WMK2_ZIZPA|nr:hypothetical protein GUJ93_ZPchr0012g21353 [Zizania palustris]